MKEEKGMIGFSLDRAEKKSAADEHKGIFIKDFSCGDLIVIRTKDFTYYFELINPETGEVKVATPPALYRDLYIEKISGKIHLAGSSLTGTGTMVKIGWIAVGYMAQLEYKLQEVKPNKLSNGVNLQPTKSISVNGTQVLPPVDEKGN